MQFLLVLYVMGFLVSYDWYFPRVHLEFSFSSLYSTRSVKPLKLITLQLFI